MSKGDIVKTRIRNKCYKCKKNLPKGTWCYGKGYYGKVCLVCQKKILFPARITAGEDYIEKANKELKDLELNWDKYEQVNMIANLQD